jgi:GNAT superfamily N-acetyltransferase
VPNAYLAGAAPNIKHMSVVLISPAQEPALAEQMLALLPRSWPTFLLQAGAPNADDPPTDWSRFITDWPAHQLALIENEEVVATAHAVPLSWDGALPPDTGWDWAVREAGRGSPLVTLCALAVTVAPEAQGRGLSKIALQGLGNVARQHGLKRLIVPVRPNHKHRLPHMTMADYLEHRTEDGLPEDPWLRTHIRRGGRIMGVCSHSMQLAGTAADWARWTGLPLSEDGEHVIPGGLSPLQIHNGIGRYAEANVWVEHPL